MQHHESYFIDERVSKSLYKRVTLDNHDAVSARDTDNSKGIWSVSQAPNDPEYDQYERNIGPTNISAWRQGTGAFSNDPVILNRMGPRTSFDRKTVMDRIDLNLFVFRRCDQISENLSYPAVYIRYQILWYPTCAPTGTVLITQAPADFHTELKREEFQILVDDVFDLGFIYQNYDTYELEPPAPEPLGYYAYSLSSEPQQYHRRITLDVSHLGLQSMYDPNAVEPSDPVAGILYFAMQPDPILYGSLADGLDTIGCQLKARIRYKYL